MCHFLNRPRLDHGVRVWCIVHTVQKFPMDFDTFVDEMFNEINTNPGDVFDVIEEEKFDLETYINGDTDY